ncbi:MAG: FadR family transcriptional regulator [Spirochaetes bacterium]|nr:FadR family transcriptional regulator [Spirochaetota bacterium]MBU1080604.1 FadR family transcriptional regulator [Spirochaetota bacterium]
MEKKRAELVRALSAMIRKPEDFPGGRLPPERELAESLGVSRNLLREAIITMEAMGLLEVRERQGAFIAAPGADDLAASLRYLSVWPDDVLAHVMEMRLIIEAPAATLAASRRTRAELERLAECVRRLEAAEGDAESAGAWDARFHALIVAAAHNPVLDRVYEGLSAAMEKFVILSRRRLLQAAGWPAKVAVEHRRIVAALEAGDEAGTGTAVREHLEEALKQLGRPERA